MINRKRFKIEPEETYYTLYERKWLFWRYVGSAGSVEELQLYIEKLKKFPKYYD